MHDAGTGMQVCKNCSNSFTGKFCNSCGQAETHRITMHHVFHDLVHVFLHADKGVFPYMSRVIKEPGIMAREYVEGKRRIFNPFQFLILSVGLIIFLLSLSDFYKSLDSYTSTTLSGKSPVLEKAMADINQFVRKYTNVITFLSVPLYALVSRVMFRKRKTNYAEHLTMLVFSMSQVNIFTALFLIGIIVFKVSSISSVIVSICLLIASFIITFHQFFSIGWLKAAWKGIVVYIAGYIGLMLLMMISLVVYIIILKSKQ